MRRPAGRAGPPAATDCLRLPAGQAAQAARRVSQQSVTGEATPLRYRRAERRPIASSRVATVSPVPRTGSRVCNLKPSLNPAFVVRGGILAT